MCHVLVIALIPYRFMLNGLEDELLVKHCKNVVGPIIGHANNKDSWRRQLMLHEFKSIEGQ